MPATVIDALVVTLGLDAAKFKDGQQDAQKSLKDTEQQANTTAKTLQSKGNQGAEFFGRLAVGAAGLVVAYEGIRKTMDSLYKTAAGGAAAGRQAFQLNMSVTDLMAWENAMKSIGGSAEGASSAIQQLVQDQQAMRTGTPPRSMQVAAQFGVNPNGNITQIAEGFEKSPAFNRLTPAMKEYWLSQVISDPTMRYAIENHQVESLLKTQATKGNLTPAQFKIEQNYLTATNNFVQSLHQFNTLVSTDLMPAFTNFINGLTLFINWVDRWIPGGGDKTLINQYAPSDPSDIVIGGADGLPILPTSSVHASQTNDSSGETIIGRVKNWMGILTDSQSQTMKQSRNYLTKLYGPVVAAAIVGNEYAESSFNPAATSTDKNGNVHTGLFQWSRDRRNAILNGTGGKIDVWKPDSSMQLQGLVWELQHDKAAALAHMKAAATVADAAGIFNDEVEVSGVSDSQKLGRAEDAMRFYNAAGTTSGSTKIDANITIHAPSGDPKVIAASVTKALDQIQKTVSKTGNAVN